MGAKKGKGVYSLPLNDIKEINDAFLTEMENVKKRLNVIKDKPIIDEFQKVLLDAYNATIALKAREREVDYDIKLAEIKERKRNLKPWRRCWLWKLLFKPLTNRAQDIIEDRAELDADLIHAKAEKELEEDRKLLPPKKGAKLKLEEIIENSDDAEPQDVLYEKTAQEQLEEQIRREEEPPVPQRRPRPPRSCRRPPT